MPNTKQPEQKTISEGKHKLIDEGLGGSLYGYKNKKDRKQNNDWSNVMKKSVNHTTKWLNLFNRIKTPQDLEEEITNLLKEQTTKTIDFMSLDAKIALKEQKHSLITQIKELDQEPTREGIIQIIERL